MKTKTGIDDATGDCFIVAFNLAVDNDWKLCHGLVVRPADGMRHWHAWAERTDHLVFPQGDERSITVVSVIAIDKANGNDLMLPAEVYRSIGGGVHEIHEYTEQEASALALETGHFGPWHDGWDA